MKSLEVLEKSQKEVNESNLNDYILNAHRVAKEILETSSQKVTELENSALIEGSAMSLQNFLTSKTKADIIAKTSYIVQEYIKHNKNDFNTIAVKQLSESLSKQ